MLSDKVVCAIRVMNLLAYSPPGQRSARGIDSGFLKELLGVEFSLYKSVITTLVTGKICIPTGRMIYLCKGVERVTVYDLMFLFHKGLPLGAPTEIEWNKGDYLYDRHYARLRNIENTLEKELKLRLKSMYVLELLSPEPENKQVEESDGLSGTGKSRLPGETIRENPERMAPKSQ